MGYKSIWVIEAAYQSNTWLFSCFHPMWWGTRNSIHMWGRCIEFLVYWAWKNINQINPAGRRGLCTEFSGKGTVRSKCWRQSLKPSSVPWWAELSPVRKWGHLLCLFPIGKYLCRAVWARWEWLDGKAKTAWVNNFQHFLHAGLDWPSSISDS